MSLQQTPRANRLHIGIFGRRNAGKSSLINALTRQEIALVSPVAGTTADPVYKSMEIHGIGPVVFVDTAGFDDQGDLGKLRVEKTRETVEKIDVALVVFADPDISLELSWIKLFQKNGTPVITVVNKVDVRTDAEEIAAAVHQQSGLMPILASALEGTGMEEIRNELRRSIPEDYDAISIIGSLAGPGDTVLLVMPQDIQAPKGRLILPQVQTLRELLDRKCIVTCVTTDQMAAALAALVLPPHLIITDSQVFRQVYEKKPAESKLTSFSILFANYKGDLAYFAESASAIESLTESSRVLIAEACTHAPVGEDIGREQLPRLLKKRIGPGLQVDLVSGKDFPKDLSPYDLIIHCGACMFNRKLVLSRVEQAKIKRIPMTNYGVVLAYLNGILDQIDY